LLCFHLPAVTDDGLTARRESPSPQKNHRRAACYADRRRTGSIATFGMAWEWSSNALDIVLVREERQAQAMTFITPRDPVRRLQPAEYLPSWDNGSVQKGRTRRCVTSRARGRRQWDEYFGQILSKCGLFQLAKGQPTFFRSIHAKPQDLPVGNAYVW
jgi:hypothetical protein